MVFNGKTMSVVACFHDDKAVSYAPQALTEEERQQARYNIGVFAETDSVLSDDHINTLIDAKLGVIENGTY